MLSQSDTDIKQFLPLFASNSCAVAFLVPTQTGFDKSIMDATAPVRELLYNAGIHDYEKQLQGPENKTLLQTFLVSDSDLQETTSSLYRPVTKKGDPRIWIYNLKNYCVPRNLLALIVLNNALYVFNLSNPLIKDSLLNHGFCHSILEEYSHKENCIAEELLAKLQVIHNQGFLPSITSGDPGVGDTLEHALGIKRNNSINPDYKGIELKTTRLTRNGKKRSKTRATLFSRVPDAGMTYREIVDNYGKLQIPRGETLARLQLYETLKCSRKNSYDLILESNIDKNEICLMYESNEQIKKYVSTWYISNLKKALLLKHHETFWIQAQSEINNGIEYFRYDKVLHTKKPNASLIAPLIENDIITIDLAAHYDQKGKYRDHGVLFKILPDNLPLLLGEPKEYIL